MYHRNNIVNVHLVTQMTLILESVVTLHPLKYLFISNNNHYYININNMEEYNYVDTVIILILYFYILYTDYILYTHVFKIIYIYKRKFT